MLPVSDTGIWTTHIAGHRHQGWCRLHRHSASYISVRYRSIPLPDWVFLFWYWAGSGICILCHSGTGSPGCGQSDIQSCWWWIGIHPARHYTAGGRSVKFTLWCWEILSKMPEFQEKASPASVVELRQFAIGIQVSGQSGTAGQGLVRHRPSLTRVGITR